MKKYIKFLIILIFSCIGFSNAQSLQKNYSGFGNYLEFDRNHLETVYYGYNSQTKTPTTFLEYFQKLYKFGYYNIMLELTSDVSINKFGRDFILNSYMSKNIDFEYKNLKFIQANVINFDKTELSYVADIVIKNEYLKVTVVFEDDKVKLLLPNNFNKTQKIF